jgi:predicted hydrocarbon binding protein
MSRSLVESGRFRPYRVGRVLIELGAKPYFFEVILKPEALWEVGVLAKLASAFTESGVPLLGIKMSAARSGERLRILFAADLKGREGEAAKLVDRLKRVSGVEQVEYAPPLFDGVTVDAWSHPLLLDNERAAILPYAFITGMLKRGWSEFGTGFAAILYHVALAGTVEECKKCFEYFGRDECVKLFEERFRLLGFGVLKIERLTEREMVARVYDSIECSAFRGAGEPRGALTRGIVAGIAAVVWNAPPESIVAEEVKCLAKGDSYCEFRVRRR